MGARPVDIGGRQERALLALLLSAPGRVFSVPAIVAGLWGDQPPAGAEKTVLSYVSRLRRGLPERAATAVVTRRPGYLVAADPDQVDAERFRSLVATGHRALDAGHPVLAGASLREGLGLWRGDAYAEFDAPFAVAERRELEELRLTALEDRAASDLAVGAGPELVGELEALVNAHPLRERLWVLLMTALYRTGRQGDALRAYRSATSALAEELGVAPAEELRSLHARVLAHDPRLLGPTVRAPAPRLGAVVGPAFVGRTHELDVLVRAYHQAVTGAPAGVLVTGPHGMGKTRLLTELARHVEVTGGTVADWPAGASPDPRGAPALLVVDDLQRRSAPDLAGLSEALSAPPRPALAVAACVEDLLSPEGARVAADLFPDRLALPPLGGDEVVALVELYVPRIALAEALAAPEVAGSAGVPLQVHAAASRYAEALAAARIGTAAAAIAEPRRRLAQSRDRVAEGVTEVARLRSLRQANGGPGAARHACPYKGLAYFDVDDAPLFAGRERLVARLVARLVDAPVLAIVGASGSGKSSVVRAGLVPAIHEGLLPGSERWHVVVSTPARPLPELPRARVAPHAPGRRPGRGGVHGPPAGGADRLRPTADGRGGARGHHGRGRDPVRLLRPARGLPEPRRPPRGEHRAGRRDVGRGAASGRGASRRGGRTPGGARPRRGHRRGRRRRARRPAAAVHGAGLAVGAGRRPAPGAHGIPRDRRRPDRGVPARRDGVRADDVGAADPRPAPPPSSGGGRRRGRASPSSRGRGRAVRRRRTRCPDGAPDPGRPASADGVRDARRGGPRGAAAGVASAAGLARGRRGRAADAPAPRPRGGGLARRRAGPRRALPGPAVDRGAGLPGRPRRRPDGPREGLPPGEPAGGRGRRGGTQALDPEAPSPRGGPRGRSRARARRHLDRRRPAERLSAAGRPGRRACAARCGAPRGEVGPRPAVRRSGLPDRRLRPVTGRSPAHGAPQPRGDGNVRDRPSCARARRQRGRSHAGRSRRRRDRVPVGPPVRNAHLNRPGAERGRRHVPRPQSGRPLSRRRRRAEPGGRLRHHPAAHGRRPRPGTGTDREAVAGTRGHRGAVHRRRADGDHCRHRREGAPGGCRDGLPRRGRARGHGLGRRHAGRAGGSPFHGHGRPGGRRAGDRLGDRQRPRRVVLPRGERHARVHQPGRDGAAARPHGPVRGPRRPPRRCTTPRALRPVRTGRGPLLGTGRLVVRRRHGRGHGRRLGRRDARAPHRPAPATPAW